MRNRKTQPFLVTVRTADQCTRYTDELSTSSAEAALKAAQLCGDTPCGVTVTVQG
jgi:hypothetical protein